MIAEHQLRTLVSGVIETISRGRKFHVHLSDADYAITLLRNPDLGSGQAVVSIRAAYREKHSTGQTWWQHWYEKLPYGNDPILFTTFLARQINNSRERFTRMLERAS